MNFVPFDFARIGYRTIRSRNRSVATAQYEGTHCPDRAKLVIRTDPGRGIRIIVTPAKEDDLAMKNSRAAITQQIRVLLADDLLARTRLLR